MSCSDSEGHSATVVLALGISLAIDHEQDVSYYFPFVRLLKHVRSGVS